MDHFLLALMQGGLLGARLGLGGGTHSMVQLPVPPPCHHGASRQLCLARGMEKPWGAGCCWGGSIVPHLLQGFVPKFEPKSRPPQKRIWGWSCCRQQEIGHPRVGTAQPPAPAARWVYLQTGGSWHRAAGHHRDPAAYNVNYHHVIKSP